MITKILISVVGIILLFICTSCDSPIREYYNDGTIKAEYYLKEGKVNGTKIEYYESGELMSEIQYDNGLKSGCEKFFYKSGFLKSKSTYSNGMKNGNLFIYYPSGKKEYQSSFQNGIRVDTSYYYSDDGNLREFKIYGKNGKIAYLRRFGPDGDLIIDSIIPILSVSSDSVQLGTTVYVEVDLTFKLMGKVYIEFGKKEDANFLSDTTYHLDPSESKIRFGFKSSTFGINEYYIKIRHESAGELTADGVIKEINVIVFGSELTRKINIQSKPGFLAVPGISMAVTCLLAI